MIQVHTFPPCLEYLADMVASSVFVNYSGDSRALIRATEAFINDHFDGECSCLDLKSGFPPLPGEIFLLSENKEPFGLSVERPTARCILDLIDELVNPDMFLETETLNQKSIAMETPKLGTFFDVDQQQFIDYIALDQLLDSSTSTFPTNHTKSNSDHDVLGISEHEDVSLSITRPLKLAYFNADTQRLVAYTAFNQLLNVEEEEVFSRIYRAHDDFEDFGLDLNVREITSISVNNQAPPHVVADSRWNDFDFFEPVDKLPSTTLPPILAKPYSSKSQRRPQLSLSTQLEPIMEEEEHGSSLSSSEDSIDFANH